MAKYQILFTSSAERELDKLNVILINKIISKIESLYVNPYAGAKKLKGAPVYRIRVSNYRVVYEIDDSKKQITIFRIRHRKDVYRNL